MDMTRGNLIALAGTLVLAGLGGTAAAAAHLPLGFMLGSIVAVGLAAALNLRVAGRGVFLPNNLRMVFVPVIGVAIGGAFTPEVAAQASGWWVSLLVLAVYVPVAHALGYAIYRGGGLDRVTAFFSAVPGGLIESVELGEAAGAKMPLLTSLHFLRLIWVIVSVPLIFWALTGHQVGSGAGAQIGGPEPVLELGDMAILVASGILGAAVGRVLHLPAWILTGPLLVSALVHGVGWVQGVPPGWLVAVTQVVVGGGLGARFTGVVPAVLRQAVGLAAIYGVAVLTLACLFALGLQAVGAGQGAALFLAFAPGGVAEMSLIALSLEFSVVFVTVHHVARIMMSVLVAKVGSRWVR